MVQLPPGQTTPLPPASLRPGPQATLSTTTMTCPSLLPQLQAVASHRADVLWVPATSQGPAWGATGQCLVWGRSLGCAAEATLRFAVCFFFFFFFTSLSKSCSSPYLLFKAKYIAPQPCWFLTLLLPLSLASLSPVTTPK